MKYLVLVPCLIFVISACAPILWTFLMISKLDFLRPMRKQNASTDADSGSISDLWRFKIISWHPRRPFFGFSEEFCENFWINQFINQTCRALRDCNCACASKMTLFLDAVLLDLPRIEPRHRLFPFRDFYRRYSGCQFWKNAVKYLRDCDPDLPTNQGGLHKITLLVFIIFFSSRTSWISFPIEIGLLLFAEMFLTARRRDSSTGSVLGFLQAWLVFKPSCILNDRSPLTRSYSEVRVLFTKRIRTSGMFEPSFLFLDEAAPVYFTCHLNNFAASCPIIP